jgi:lipopolysaccharide/colanic/teichoic acid biosynthesis glycosyltransferase
MTIIPVLLDSRPAYLDRGVAPSSLLLLPMGTGTLLGQFASRLAVATASRPLVLPTFEPGGRYEDAVRAAGAGVEVVPGLAALRARIAEYDPSDSLLIVDPSCCPAGGLDVQPLVAVVGDDFRMARHLLALEVTSGRTKEYVHSDANGRLRKIQRYYHPVTWPFACGIVCSLIPVASTLTAPDLPLTSLPELRRALAAAGVPSRDIPLGASAFDLGDEGGLLGLSERFVTELAAPGDGRKRTASGASPYRGRGCTVHPSARLLGPVLVMDDAVIDAGAVVVGPTLIGAGARVGAGAVVAQCLVLPGTVVMPEETVRHRVVASAGLELAATAGGGRTTRHNSGRHSALPVEVRQESRRSIYAAVKRAADASAALAFLLLLSPLLLVLALLVKFGSRGPILYGGEREGKNGRPFRCWKFRSMYVGADARQRELAARNHVDGPQFKMDDDPRVTTIGRLLRRTNLDELPQLLNVLLGEMSLVGPRPSPFRENQVCVPWRQGRLSVRPGITGLWQVCRHDRENGDFHQWIQYDLLYVRHASLWIDVKILAATILTLGGRRPVPLSMIIPAKHVEQAPVRAAVAPMLRLSRFG